MTDAPFSPRELRDALSSFATGVTIVTASDEQNQPVGMTASSFNSVSMDPPLVLWSIGKSAFSAPIFTRAEHFSIHILGADQIALSNAFAKSGTDKFSTTDYKMSNKNVPHLKGAITRFDCKTWNVHEGGDHWIIIGEVINIAASDGDGLVFSGGSYAAANPIALPEPFVPSTVYNEAPIESLLIYNLSHANNQMGQQFHAAVQSCGLTIAEWRILACLQGGKKSKAADLVARTFVDPGGLNDILKSMCENGLCNILNEIDGMSVSSTPEGDARVEHLFELGSEQELSALGDAGKKGLSQLNTLLKQVVRNTNKSNSN